MTCGIRDEYKSVMKTIDKEIVGQETAKKTVQDTIIRIKAGLSEPNRPLSVIFATGPTGVGKSEMATALAKGINSSKRNFSDSLSVCRVDYNSLSTKGSSASLVGSPVGYIGSQEGDTLLDKEKIEGKHGYPGILVFEEIEKAHPEVIKTLLEIFDKARLRMLNGKDVIDFSNTIIICTSNAGSDALAGMAKTDKQNRELVEKVAKKALTSHFPPEFIGRLDSIVAFDFIDEQVAKEITMRLLAKYEKKLKARIILSEEAMEFIIENGFDERYGARSLKTVVSKYIIDPIAKLIADDRRYPEYYFGVRGGQIKLAANRTVRSGSGGAKQQQFACSQGNTTTRGSSGTKSLKDIHSHCYELRNKYSQPSQDEELPEAPVRSHTGFDFDRAIVECDDIARRYSNAPLWGPGGQMDQAKRLIEQIENGGTAEGLPPAFYSKFRSINEFLDWLNDIQDEEDQEFNQISSLEEAIDYLEKVSKEEKP